MKIDGHEITRDSCFDKVKTAGRPALKLNDLGKEIITKLSSIMCKDEEIASILSVKIEVLQNSLNGDAFRECKEKGQQEGKASLRRIQFDLARKNAAMAIFLGKQWLGQTDEPTRTGQEAVNVTLEIKDVSNERKPDNT